MFFNSSLIAKAQEILKKAQEKNLKISCAESCTGGLLSALFTEVSGSSKVFDRGFVTYSNEAKIQMLGVEKELLEHYGAVSAEVAAQMARGAVKNSAAQISVAITGIAGPDGGSLEKPVGLVYIAVFNKINDRVIVRKFNFSGDRTKIRKSSLVAALSAIEAVL